MADLIRLFYKWLFELTLPGKIDKAEDEYFKQAPIPKPPEAIIIEHPINYDVQTGESQKLGGPLEISAPWYEGAKSNGDKPQP